MYVLNGSSSSSFGTGFGAVCSVIPPPRMSVQWCNDPIRAVQRRYITYTRRDILCAELGERYKRRFCFSVEEGEIVVDAGCVSEIAETMQMRREAEDESLSAAEAATLLTRIGLTETETEMETENGLKEEEEEGACSEGPSPASPDARIDAEPPPPPPKNIPAEPMLMVKDF